MTRACRTISSRTKCGFSDETARKLPDSLRVKFPAGPWRHIVGTGDFLAHGHYQVEPETVRDIVEKDLAALEVEIKRIVESM
ncbi:MAG: DUF86 domain-containing protein [Proteobacteria bacterium]|nr:DUF86 domain-containing protein [Pseudomonadota bacterium]